MDARKALEEAIAKGEEVPDSSTIFDSNCITPGTDFMGRLSNALQFFVRKKIAEDEVSLLCPMSRTFVLNTKNCRLGAV